MEKKPHVLFGTPQPPAARSNRPKIVVAGTQRNRIPCSLQDLETLDGGASASVRSEALQAVNGVNLDDHYFEDVVGLGAALQSEHGQLASAQLDLISNPALSEVKAMFLDLVERLERLDPRHLFDAGTGPARTVKQFFGRRLFGGGLNERAFEAEYAGIRTLAQSLEASMPVVRRFQTALNRMNRRYATLARSLEAQVLACRFILNHIEASTGGELSPHYQSQRSALESREASLSATRATLEVSRQTLKLLAQGIEDFSLSGEDFTRRDLPAWYTAVSAALLARRTRSPDGGLIEAAMAAHQLILSKLKGKEAL